MLIKIFSAVFSRLVCKLTPEKQEKYRKVFHDFVVDVASASAEGFAKGITSGDS